MPSGFCHGFRTGVNVDSWRRIRRGYPGESTRQNRLGAELEADNDQQGMELGI